MLGEGKKYDKARNHASRGKDAAVKTGKDSEDFSKDLNKSKYKNGKKTKVDGNPWENKWEKLSTEAVAHNFSIYLSLR